MFSGTKGCCPVGKLEWPICVCGTGSFSKTVHFLKPWPAELFELCFLGFLPWLPQFPGETLRFFSLQLLSFHHQ